MKTIPDDGLKRVRPACGRPVRWVASVWLLVACVVCAHAAETIDLVVYGGTAGGIAAAVQAGRMGKTVLLIEPSHRVGGLTTGGLGQTDLGRKQVIGGLSREFYQRVRRHYADPAAWIRQTPESYRDAGQTRTGKQEDAMWTFEPSVALRILEGMLREQEIPVLFGERLDRSGNTGSGALGRGVRFEARRLHSITLESGKIIRGRMFIDATYEGDLMAAAGVPYVVGREANATYEESLNGVETRLAVHHQLQPGVDPYVIPGDPASGLLPFIDPRGPGPEQSGDHRVQAYCFRMCLTDHPENRIPFHRPPGYNPQWYELLLRNFEAGEQGMPWINSPMPNRKTDTNNRTGYSTDFIGQNYAYPEATYEERDRIVARHRLYQQGLMWTLAHHPRVPDSVRGEIGRWGTCKDEFAREDGWQHQLYIREARRMVSDFVVTELHLRRTRPTPRPIGMGSYNMDSHHVQRILARTPEGTVTVRNEGDVQESPGGAYPIDYGAVVPPQSACENLLVPVCVSSSHIAFGSIRMEPVFMILGQSAGAAACLAIDHDLAVQELPYPLLQAQLLADGQILEDPSPAGRRWPVRDLSGIVVDDQAAIRNGHWVLGTGTFPHVGRGYHHDGNTGKGTGTVQFAAALPAPGMYEVRLAWPCHPNRATNVPVDIHARDGVHRVLVNQRKPPDIDGISLSLGRFAFDARALVEISTAQTDGHVIADAVQFIPTDAWRPLWSADRMPGWEVIPFGGAGEISFTNGLVTIGSGFGLTGLIYTNPIPRSDYEIELEVQRVSGSDFACGLTFPVADACCTLIFGGWGGGVIGISSIDGLDASENQTALYREIESGRWYHLRVRVEAARLQVWLDRESIIRQELEGRTIGMRPGEIEMCQPFGLTTYETVGAIRGLRLRTLSAGP